MNFNFLMLFFEIEILNLKFKYIEVKFIENITKKPLLGLTKDELFLPETYF